ncbi:PREDICTED: uncharacterized protein LOC106914531 isoform X2 [Poecilia mexicana]|uniref:uncharacterized protein LOC106914531 isoform X2 n=1 Tax=Poecilia mexicana TaxID=48701 RepID=UPI00072DEC31|nr:PREDICTED: uncharacterized protein LOC106914531 isoform X2 [Poecilia mexicana]
MDYGFVDCHCHISALEFQQFLVPGSVCVLLVVTGPNVERSARSEDFRSQPSLFSSAGSSGCDPQNQAGRGKDSGGRHRGSGGILQSSPSAGKISGPGGSVSGAAPPAGRRGSAQRPASGPGRSSASFLQPQRTTGRHWRDRVGFHAVVRSDPTGQRRPDEGLHQTAGRRHGDGPTCERPLPLCSQSHHRHHETARALLHNFSGKPAAAMEAVEAGFFFSFPPAVCRNQQRDRLIQRIPLDHICLETDAPALGLHRNERNEPANITLSCSYIAKVKGQTPETVREVTTQNAYRLFSRASR